MLKEDDFELESKTSLKEESLKTVSSLSRTGSSGFSFSIDGLSGTGNTFHTGHEIVEF